MNDQLDRLLSTTYFEPFPTTDQAPASQIRATAGLGKTRELVMALAQSDYWRSCEIHYYAPDHDQADEVEKLARELGLRTQHIRGRSPSQGSLGYCARYDLTKKIAELDLGVYKTLCDSGGKERCPHFDHCPYLRQWEDTSPALRIFPHIYLFLYRFIRRD